MRWGEQLEFVAEAGPSDFIYVPPYVPHREINASVAESLSCVLVRSGQEPVVVNLDITPAEAPEAVEWVDDLHARLRAEGREASGLVARVRERIRNLRLRRAARPRSPTNAT
jgi:hypothetical protein